MTTADGRTELRDYLVANRISGDVATPRENNLRNIALLARGDPQYTFGLQVGPEWDVDRILKIVADRVGISADPDYRAGSDRIDPERTLDRLDAMAERLVVAADKHERVFFATGHPSGLLSIDLVVAQALAAAGADVITPQAGLSYESAAHGLRHRRRQIRYIGEVAMVSSGGELNHTHSARPMELLLENMRALGEPWPDLVVADHGWAGAAGQAGIAAVGFADSNDPALFVGEADGRVEVVVPLDDNVLPHLYAPVAAYLVGRLQA
ncbi:MAG: phosphatase [Actinomycetes bacterium]